MKSPVILTLGCFVFAVTFIFYRRIADNSQGYGQMAYNGFKSVAKAPLPKVASGVQSADDRELEEVRKRLIDLFDEEEVHPYSPPKKSDSSSTKASSNDYIATLEEFLKPFHENITQTRKKLLPWLDTTSFNDLLPVTTVANGYKEGFFEKVMALDAVSTVVLWGDDLNHMRKVLPDRYFDYIASDCDGLENHAIYGERDGKRFYNATCSNTLSDLWKAKPLGIVPFGMGLPANGVDTLRRVWNKPKAVPGTYLLVIKDAVASQNGDVWVGSTKIVIQRCYQDLKPKLPNNWRNAKLYKELFDMTQYFGGSFFHFHVEGLPRMMPYLKWLEENPHIPILITEQKYKNAFEGFLNVIKLPRERFVTNRMARAKILYMPAGGICGRSNLFGTVATSIYFKGRSGINPVGKPDSVIFIKRSSRGRLWMNHDVIYDQVKKEAKRRGLKTVLFSDKPSPTFEESIKMFSKAVLVVGPHGAGLSHLLWAPPGTVIVEGLCDIVPHKVNLCYRNLAQMLGMRWYGIFKGCVRTTPVQVTPIVTYYLDKYLESSSKGY